MPVRIRKFKEPDDGAPREMFCGPKAGLIELTRSYPNLVHYNSSAENDCGIVEL